MTSLTKSFSFRLSLLRKLILWLFSCYFLVRIVRIRNRVHETYKLLLALPHDSIPSSVSKYSLDLNGPLKRNFPNGLKSYSEIPRELIPFLERQREKYKNEGLFVVWIANYNLSPIPLCTIFVTDIKLVREVCRAKNSHIFEKGRAYSVISGMFGDGIVSARFSDWEHQRRVLDRGYTEAMMDAQYPVVKKTTAELIARLNYICESGGENVNLDVLVEMQKATLDILGKVSFGYDMGCLKAEGDQKPTIQIAFETILDTLAQRVFSPIKLLCSKFPTEENRKYRWAVSFLDNLVREIIQTRKKKAPVRHPRDMLDVFLSDNSLPERIILDNMKGLLFAGEDTTSAALTWGLYLLSKNSNAVEKIRTERDKLGKTYSRKDVEKCEFLNAVILEILRMYPGAGTIRKANKAFQLGEYVIPPDIDIFCFSYMVQRNEKYYKNADEFIPERWVNGDDENISLQAKLGKLSRSKNEAYMPFSLGKRNCAGRKLALLEMREVLLEVLDNFDIAPAKQPTAFQEIPYYYLTAAPKSVHVIFNKRQVA